MLLFTLFSATTAEPEAGFLKRQVEVEGETFAYQVFVPDDWTDGRRWPVILFLHGAGERGSDGIEQTEVGLAPAIRRNPHRFAAIVVMPQCRKGVWWNDPLMEKQAMEALRQSMQEWNGDESRVYLTGLSMGGYATFYFGAKYSDRFAALVPICGGIVPPRQDPPAGNPAAPYRQTAENISHIPIWIFHGDADPVVPVSESRKMREQLEGLHTEVRYTEYPGVGHNSWDKAYAEPDLIPWLLSKSKETRKSGR